VYIGIIPYPVTESVSTQRAHMLLFVKYTLFTLDLHYLIFSFFFLFNDDLGQDSLIVYNYILNKLSEWKDKKQLIKGRLKKY